MNIDILHQSEVWVDANGVEHYIPFMSPRHKRNVVKFLERNASTICTHVALDIMSQTHMITGEQALIEIDRGIERMEQNPVDWIHDLPLMEALNT